MGIDLRGFQSAGAGKAKGKSSAIVTSSGAASSGKSWGAGAKSGGKTSGKSWSAGKTQAPAVWQPLFNKSSGKGYGKSLSTKGWDKGAGKGKKGRGLRDFPIDCKVWIGGAPDPCDLKALQEHMKQAGNAKYISVAKGQGGCAYATEEEVQTAIAMLNGSTFEGATLEIDVWTKKEVSNE